MLAYYGWLERNDAKETTFYKMMKYKMRKGIGKLAALIAIFAASNSNAQDIDIQSLGAVGDGVTVNTNVIQRAIDDCSIKGGRVIIPEGVFVSGTLHMKSNVELHVKEKGVLKGSPYFKDYPVNEINYKNSFSHHFNGTISLSRAFIFAEGARNISFTGSGSINGSGDAKEFDLGNDGGSAASRQRPCMLLIINCKNIKVYDLLLTNSAYWMENYIACDTIHIKGVSIFNHSNYNQDGIDIDSRNVLIEDCKIDVDDDGICFKSHERKDIPENIVVRNCTISSNCNAIKFGTASVGGLKNVSISNCTISKASADHIRHWQQNVKFIEQPITVLAGIALESVDGAIVENVTISDITMKDVQTPIFIVLGNRSRKPVGDSVYRAGQIKNVTIKNITATGHSKMCSSITGYPGNDVENVTLDNIVLDDMGKGTLQETNIAFPENSQAYPENRMYGSVYPASSFYLRHAKAITISNSKFTVRNDDFRPSVAMNDVKAILLQSLSVQSPKGKTEAIRIVKGRNITIYRVSISDTSSPLFKLIQTKSRQLTVKN